MSTAAGETVLDPRLEARKERSRRELARRHLLPFTQTFVPRYTAGWFHKDLARHLEQFSQDVLDGLEPRLMITCPPRHGKSEITTRRFPGWHLGRAPDHEIICCSYSATLAFRFSRATRNMLRDPRYNAIFPDTRLDPDAQSVENWEIDNGGGYLAAGVGGPITGSGAHILLIDDPVKNRAEAESKGVQDEIWDWYTSTAYTRLAPGGGVVLIMTRWVDNDLGGRLLEAMEDGEGDRWTVVNYPAIAEHDEAYRKKGEALHPERYPLKRLHQIRKTIGVRDWSALYQQRPITDEGAFFKPSMFRFYRRNELPPLESLAKFGAWDLAVGEKQYNDFSVGGGAGLDHTGRVWLLERAKGRWSAMDLVNEILNMQMMMQQEVVGIERGQIKMALGPFLDEQIVKRKQFNFELRDLMPGRVDKQARARTIQGLMEQGMVMFPHPDDCEWMSDLMYNMTRFPAGAFDDDVDMMAWLGMIAVHMSPPAPPKQKGARPKSWLDRVRHLTNDHGRGSAMSA